MAGVAAEPYQNAKTLISFLTENDPDSQNYALHNLLECMDYLWHELIDHIELLITLQANAEPQQKKLISIILAKIFYNKDDYDNSLNYALQAGEYLNISNRDQFVDKIISKAIDRYSVIRTHNHSAKEEERISMDAQLEPFVNTLFEETLQNPTDAKLIIGIALETRRLDIVERVIMTATNINPILEHVFELSQTTIQSKSFKNQVVELILNSYARRDGQELKRDEASNIVYCYLLLNKYNETAIVLSKLIHGSEEDFLMACQISSDIQDEENQNFSDNLIDAFNKLETTSQQVSDYKTKIVSILSGDFHEKNSFKFLNQNNHSNKDVISKLYQFWDKKASVYHNGIINCYAIMHAGTSDDTYLGDAANKAWITKNTHWAKFLSVACLGTIHKGNPKIDTVLSKYYPGKPGADDYTSGGALYGLGLAHTAKATDDKIQLMMNTITGSQKEPLIHGACLGLGLLGMSTYNKDMVDALKVFLYNESAIMGEAASYSIGLIMAGKMDAELIQELLDACRSNTHEKIIRGMAMSLALMAYQSEELADNLIDQLLESKDHVIRYGGAFAIGMAYVGTGNTGAIKKLLSVAASDTVDDVRRAAVINVGFVMLNQPEKVPKIISLLVHSYNNQVRFGAALAIGISCAGTNSKEALQTLEKLQQDPASFVRQGVAIGMSMVMQQATKNHNPIVEDFTEKLTENIKKKTEDNVYKFGAMCGLGILAAGGRNSVVTLTSSNGSCKKGAILGMVMFVQYWYWFPFVQMINLSLEPTFLMGINKDLKMPKSFSVKCNTKKSTFDYPQTKKLDDNLKESDKVVVELSTTRRAKAKHANKQKAEGKMDEETLQKTVSKMDVEEEKKAEVKPEKIEPEEPTICQLSNPCRVLKKQQNFIEFNPTNRYQPISKNRKRGYIFLKDTQPEEPEEFVDDEPLQAWLIPPPDFTFDESLQDETMNTTK